LTATRPPNRPPSADKIKVDGSGTNGAKALAVPTVPVSVRPTSVLRKCVAVVVNQRTAEVSFDDDVNCVPEPPKVKFVEIP